ncbi:MAG TPA: ABC transporter permease [Flavisolibacter sp.]
MRYRDLLDLSFRSIRSQPLRAGITIAIIALGIMALTGIITAVAAMEEKFTESFSTMGAQGFTIRHKERNLRPGSSRVTVTGKAQRKEKRSGLGKPVTMQEAEQFLQWFRYPATASISTLAGSFFKVTSGRRQTSTDIYLFGGDPAFASLNGFSVRYGRHFNQHETAAAADVCILGYDVAQQLFRDRHEDAIHKVIRINGRRYRVTGVLAARGSVFGFSRDRIVVIPYANAARSFQSDLFTIGVRADDIRQVPAAMSEAEGVFRAIRRLSPADQSNFVVERSDSIARTALNVLGYLTAAVIIIGLITLGGSSIALMNIMLVAVGERMREIGVIKAIGGPAAMIRAQFLVESVIVSVAGGAFGIILGVAMGNIFALLMDTGFVMPWRWVLYAVLLCAAVGIVAGLYPAMKAARLNPIEALRYE